MSTCHCEPKAKQSHTFLEMASSLALLAMTIWVIKQFLYSQFTLTEIAAIIHMISIDVVITFIVDTA